MRFAFHMSRPTTLKEDANPRISAFYELLDAGPDVNSKDDQGRTRLHILAADRFSDKEGYKVETARLLLARGANVSGKDGTGRTAADLIRSRNTAFKELLRSRAYRVDALEML